MLVAAVLLTLLPLVRCSGEGNVHLLEDEVVNAMKACVTDEARQKRSDYVYRYQTKSIDETQQTKNQYGHERRNISDNIQLVVLNATEYDYEGDNDGEKMVANRTKRGDPLVAKPDSDQCLSQCIFANLQVVDSRGIPREAELWNRVQASVNSEQSRGALRDQLRACFQELQSEAEDDGCSYSNKLEKCLVLRFSDRKPASTQTSNNNGKTNANFYSHLNIHSKTTGI
uniref:Putative odorant binding protein 5 n=1 Tax=Conopomorpha sinensis TaxID=940481 RepID=A0A5Q2UUU8_9NEOP|nr:putative odorant binding protein 5 [Conopomorpha sinensis]